MDDFDEEESQPTCKAHLPHNIIAQLIWTTQQCAIHFSQAMRPKIAWTPSYSGEWPTGCEWENSSGTSMKCIVIFALHTFQPVSHPLFHLFRISTHARFFVLQTLIADHIGAELGGIQMVGVARQSSGILNLNTLRVASCGKLGFPV